MANDLLIKGVEPFNSKKLCCMNGKGVETKTQKPKAWLNLEVSGEEGAVLFTSLQNRN